MADFGGKNATLIPSRTASSDEEKSVFVQLVEVLRRRLWILITVTGIVFTLAALHTFTSPKLYTATTQMQIMAPEPQVMGNAKPVVAADATDKNTIETEIAILSSQTLAQRVVASQNLIDDPEFFEPPAPKDKSKGAVSAKPSESMSPQDRAFASQIAILGLLSRLEVTRVGGTYLVDVNFTSQDPQKAARLADAVANEYIAMMRDAKLRAFDTADDFLSEQISQLSTEVQARESEVEKTRVKEGLLTAGDVRLTDQTTQMLNQQRIEKQEVLTRAMSRLEALRALKNQSPDLMTSNPEVLASPVIGGLRAQQAELERSRAEAASRWDINHPKWAELRQQAESLDAQIKAEVDRIVGSLEEQARIARQDLNNIDRQLSSQRSTLAVQNQGEVALRQKQREADAARGLNEALLARYKEVIAQSQLERPSAIVLAMATTPLGPSSPKTTLNLVIGLVLGLFAGFIAILGVELLEQSLRSPEDVQARLGVPCIGQLQFLDRRTRMIDGEPLAPEVFVLKRPLSAFGESLRNIRAAVFFASPDRKASVVGVTSALPEEGKTTVAVSLARISALAGSKVIVVDCDLRRRSATHSMGVDAEKGLTELLFRTATLDEVIQKDPQSACDILPLAQAEFTSRDLFGSDAMRSVIDTLRARYDIVLLDCAPVLLLSDTRVLSTLCDSMLVVTRWGKTPASIVRQAMNHLLDRGATIAGVVLEGVETGVISRLVYDHPDYYSDLHQTYYIR